MSDLEELRWVARLQDRAAARQGACERVAARLQAEGWSGRKQLPRQRWLLLVASATGVVAALALFALRVEPIAYVVGDLPGATGQWLETRDRPALDLSFSDGSTITLAKATAARVGSLEHAGAELVLEHGSAEFDIVRREGSSWRVRCGPYEIQVVGTRFVVGWHPAEDRLLVVVQQGRVNVSRHGALTTSLGAGDRLETTRGGEWHLKPANQMSLPSVREGQTLPATEGELNDASWNDGLPSDSSSNTDLSKDAERELKDAEAPSAPEALPSKRARAASWRSLAEQGHYKEAMAAAEQAGFEVVIETASLEELWSLATAARLAGATGRAVEAYRALRRRFSDTQQAATAAFELGRVTSGHAPREAASWFQLYVAEAPSGRLLREARGRLIEVLLATKDRPGASNAARQYLRAYPEGPHAGLARQVLGQ